MKVAFIFPGQGSQFVGMGKDLFENHSFAKQRYQQANDILGFDLARISFEGPDEKLKQTDITQPAIFVHSFIMNELIVLNDIHPDMVAGHSLGEYSALAAIQAFDFETGLKLVKMRGRLMKNAGKIQPGAMAAIIGLELKVVEEICSKASSKGVVGIANLNSPGQLVISGSVAGVMEAIDLSKEANAKKALKLNVSGAFHSPLMEPATKKFSQVLAKTAFEKPRVAVYNNVTASPTMDVDIIKSLLKDQLMSPVLWIETIKNMIADGAETFFEIGPGSVLTGLGRRIDKSIKGLSASNVQAVNDYLKGKNL